MTTWNAVFWPKLWFSLCLVGSLAILKSLFSLSCVNTSRLSLFQPMLFCLDQARLVFPYMLYMTTFWCLPLNFSPSIVSDSVIQRQFRIFVVCPKHRPNPRFDSMIKFDRKWSEKKNTLQGQGKVREYYFESRKVDILKKSKGKLKRFNTADLIFCTAVKPPVETTSRKRPLLLRNQFSKITNFSKSNHYPWNLS